MKHFITILAFILFLCSCANNPPAKPETLPIDDEADNIGNSVKTPGYTFTDGFIYHEWKGTEPSLKEIPFAITTNSYLWGQYNSKKFHPIKKLVTSKYFDIYVDITDGAGVFKIATNMTDVAYDKLIRELEKYYHKIKSVYGEPSNVDGNGKIEIVFHDFSKEKGFSEFSTGYFYDANITPRRVLYTAEMDVLYINSDTFMRKYNKEFSEDCYETIFHELQHDMFAERILNRYGFVSSEYTKRKWINEALSVSTYIVLYNGERGSGRDYIENGKREAYFNTDAIRNGKYFFGWQSSDGDLATNHYVTAANFMYWLYLHGGGDRIIRDIVNSNPYKIIDIKNIVEAVRKNIPDLKGKNDVGIVREWYLANYLNEPNSLRGYKGKTKIITAKANRKSGSVLLDRYCAVYTTLDMYPHNSHKRGLFFGNIRNKDLLIFNGEYYDPLSFSRPYSATAKINPNAIDTDIPNFNKMYASESQTEEDRLEWIDYVFMYGEEITPEDFKTVEEIEREEMYIIREKEREEMERRKENSDDFKAELEYIE